MKAAPSTLFSHNTTSLSPIRLLQRSQVAHLGGVHVRVNAVEHIAVSTEELATEEELALGHVLLDLCVDGLHALGGALELGRVDLGHLGQLAEVDLGDLEGVGLVEFAGRDGALLDVELLLDIFWDLWREWVRLFECVGWAWGLLAYDSEAVADVDGHGVQDLLLAVDDLADGVLAGGAGGDVGLEVALDGDGHVGAAVTQVSTCTYSKLA